MCGLAGFYEFAASRPAEEMRALAQRMGDTLRHRGPDDSTVWVDPQTGLAFAHRRLSIVDLSAAGRQPMVSADGRWVLAYNGEIYNHRALAGELVGQGLRLRGHSDTEVLVEALAAWGVEETLSRLNGMFAFSAWERPARVLWCARDRVGIKPLYWSLQDGLFVFGSELKALAAHPRCHLAVPL